jgi:hypothetical protein
LKITIDNYDGLGPIDYTQCMSGETPFTLQRKLSAVSVCRVLLDCNVRGSAIPAKYGRLIVTSDAGLVLFTGYVVLTPTLKLAGAGYVGLLYVNEVTAFSDELLLDQQGTPQTSGNAGLSMLTVMQALTERIDPVRFSVAAVGVVPVVGLFVAEASKPWSTNAGMLMSMARFSYRSLNQKLTLVPIGEYSHVLSETAGTLELSRLSITQSRALANDVTVCGESEAQAYVTDVFQGDGATTTFSLTRKPMTVSTLKGTLVKDTFQGLAPNKVLWQLSDPGLRMSITSAGLTVNGGSGVDGQTALTSIDNMEVSGALVLTAAGVVVGAGSAGYIACLYSGSVQLKNLYAGFSITQSGGQTVAAPILNGVPIGASITLATGHAYSFRIRNYCTELQRVFATYTVSGNMAQQSFGGGASLMPGQLVFEVQDTTGGVNQPTNILYDGAASASPATCFVCAVNSTAFRGSMQSIVLEQTGTAWVRSQRTSGSAFTRRIGLATAAADCKVEADDKLVFYTTSVPQAGELITVSYRTSGKAVARLQNAGSVLAQGTAVVPGVSAWIGTATNPAARSSVDCESAALALLSIASEPSAAWSGGYVLLNAQQAGDVWPGDALVIESPSLGVTASVIARTVTVACLPQEPETLTYAIEFSNDWAEALAVTTSSAVPSDTLLPQKALTAPSSLASLAGLVAAVTPTQINVAAGVSSPAGGGFEVRRVDWQFGTGSDGALVFRSTVPNFSIIREAAIEQYFVRMYDGSVPPNYSRFSSMICASVPL